MNSTVSQASPEGIVIPYALQEELLGYYQNPFWGMLTSLSTLLIEAACSHWRYSPLAHIAGLLAAFR
jgi:hypothetical protein